MTDEDIPLKLCKYCQKFFGVISKLFCTLKRKNQHNVHKSGKKNKEQK